MPDDLSLRLQWPEEVGQRAAVERAVAHLAAELLRKNAAAVRGMAECEGTVIQRFLQDVAEHWPPGSERPAAIAELLERFRYAVELGARRRPSSIRYTWRARESPWLRAWDDFDRWKGTSPGG